MWVAFRIDAKPGQTWLRHMDRIDIEEIAADAGFTDISRAFTIDEYRYAYGRNYKEIYTRARAAGFKEMAEHMEKHWIDSTKDKKRRKRAEKVLLAKHIEILGNFFK